MSINSSCDVPGNFAPKVMKESWQACKAFFSAAVVSGDSIIIWHSSRIVLSFVIMSLKAPPYFKRHLCTPATRRSCIVTWIGAELLFVDMFAIRSLDLYAVLGFATSRFARSSKELSRVEFRGLWKWKCCIYVHQSRAKMGVYIANLKPLPCFQKWIF